MQFFKQKLFSLWQKIPNHKAFLASVASVWQTQKIIVLTVGFALLATTSLYVLKTSATSSPKEEPTAISTESDSPSPTPNEDISPTPNADEATITPASRPTITPTPKPTNTPTPSAPTPTPPQPPVMSIAYPQENQSITMNSQQTFCMVDSPVSDTQGLQRKYKINDQNWTSYADIFTLCYGPAEGVNTLLLQYKNNKNVESPVYTRHFSFHREQDPTPTNAPTPTVTPTPAPTATPTPTQ